MQETHPTISCRPQLLTLHCHLSLFQSMLFVEIPEYRNKHIRTPVKVNFYVINGKRKRSQPQHFTYHPGNCQGQSKWLPCSHEQDFIFCYVVLLPLPENLNFTVLIQLSAAKLQLLFGLKGACDLGSGISHKFKGTVILAMSWFCRIHLMGVCQQLQWEQYTVDMYDAKITSDLGKCNKGLVRRKKSNIYSSEWGWLRKIWMLFWCSSSWELVSNLTINATGLLMRFPEFLSFGWDKNIVRKLEYCACGNQKA